MPSPPPSPPPSPAPKPLTLSTPSGGVVATLDAAGGRIASIRVDGTELLVTGADRPVDWGMFPMVPFAGRLGHGRLRFGGRDHQLPLTMPPHAIHGTLLTRRWRAVEAGTVEAGTVEAGAVEADLAAPWPFAGRVRHHVQVRDDALAATLELHALEPMPATIGWHPWFRRRLDHGGAAVLHLPARDMFERSDDHLPTGALVPVPPGPWDDCFTNLTGPPVIVWPGALTLTVETDCAYVVAFTEPGHALCVEPQTGPPDAARLGRAAVLAAGDTLVATVTLRFR